MKYHESYLNFEKCDDWRRFYCSGPTTHLLYLDLYHIDHSKNNNRIKGKVVFSVTSIIIYCILNKAKTYHNGILILSRRIIMPNVNTAAVVRVVKRLITHFNWHCSYFEIFFIKQYSSVVDYGNLCGAIGDTSVTSNKFLFRCDCHSKYPCHTVIDEIYIRNNCIDVITLINIVDTNFCIQMTWMWRSCLWFTTLATIRLLICNRRLWWHFRAHSWVRETIAYSANFNLIFCCIFMYDFSCWGLTHVSSCSFCLHNLCASSSTRNSVFHNDRCWHLFVTSLRYK